MADNSWDSIAAKYGGTAPVSADNNWDSIAAKYGGTNPAAVQDSQPQGNFGQRFGQNLIDSVNPWSPNNFVSQAALPAAKGIASMPYTVAKGGATASVGGLGSAWNAMQAQVAGGNDQQIEAARRAPINTSWFGNINPNTDPGKTAALAVDTGISGANMLMPTSSVFNTILRGGAQGAAQAVEQGQTDPWKVAEQGVLSGGISGASQLGLNAIQGLSAKYGGTAPSQAKTEAQALETGTPVSTINRTENLSPEDLVKQQQFIDMAKNKITNPYPDSVNSPMEDLADKVIAGARKLDALQENAGQGLGATAQGLYQTADAGGAVPTVNTSPVQDSILSFLKSKRMGLDDNGQLAFGPKSIIDEGSSDAKLIQKIIDKVGLDSQAPLDEAVGNKAWLQDILKVPNVRADTSSAQDFGKLVIKNLTDQIHETSPELKNLDELFSNLSNLTAGTDKATTGSNPIDNKEWLNGVNTRNLLTRGLSNANEESNNIVQQLAQAGDKYGVPELQNIDKTRWLAQAAQDAVNMDAQIKPTSLGGVLGKTAGSVLIGRPKAGLKNLLYETADLLQGNTPNVSALQNLIRGAKQNNSFGPAALGTVKYLTGLGKSSAGTAITSAPYNAFKQGFVEAHPQATDQDIQQAFAQFNQQQ